MEIVNVNKCFYKICIIFKGNVIYVILIYIKNVLIVFGVVII